MSNATKVNKGKPQQNEEQAASPIKSNATKANEVVRTHQPEPASKYANTSNEASLVEKEVRDAIVVFSSNFDVALINEIRLIEENRLIQESKDELSARNS